MMQTMEQAHNIYIHVPFCKSKCNYCAFFSAACANPDWTRYADGIIREIDYWAEKLGKISVPTIFFGGGTPSLMPTNIFDRIMTHIRDKFNIIADAEVTIEANPKTLDKARLREFISSGVNRLSVGVQSLNDDKLRFLGRCHSATDARELLDAAMNIGLRVSADFIYGLPGDDVAEIIEICKQINNIGLQHVSMYELTIEPDTPFGKMNLDMPTNSQMADMYNAIDDNLSVPRYEVSNYAAPAQECRHNLNVWDGAPYIGIGNGAAGRIFMNNAWYQQRGAGAEFTPITNTQRGIEMLITGLRMVRGAQINDLTKPVINNEWVDKNPDLITIKNGRVCATKKGMLILDDLLLNLTR